MAFLVGVMVSETALIMKMSKTVTMIIMIIYTISLKNPMVVSVHGLLS